MPKRTANPVTAVIASFLVGAPFTAIPIAAARASDNCLAAPTDQAPAGSHWYYRTDHASQRCWYLKEVTAGLSQIAPPNSLPFAKLISPQTLTTTQGSIADARAELATPTAAPAPEQSQSRDDEPSPATAPETSATQEDHSGPRPPPVEETHRSMLMAALAFAGILGSVIFKLGSLQRSRRVKHRKRRGAIWASAGRNRRKASALPVLDDLTRRRGLARDLDRAGEIKVEAERFYLSYPNYSQRNSGYLISPTAAATPARTSSTRCGVRASAAPPSGSTEPRRTRHRYRD
jgi:hypothetical protein